VVVRIARHEPEADLMVNILREADIPAFARRARGFELPDFFGFGAREVLVRADRRDEARRVLDPFDARPAPGMMPGDDGSPSGSHPPPG
jgi:hypothetical protein